MATMMAFPEKAGLYDLEAFAKTLPVGGQFKKIRGAIARIATAGSAQADLSLAAAHFAAGVELELAKGNFEPNSALIHSISANFNFSLILYARATQTSSNHRPSLNVQDRFNEHEKNQHKMLFALRNDAVAHFGPGPEGVNKSWSKDSAVLRVSPDGALSIATPYVRKGHMLVVNDALDALIPIASSIVSAILSENHDVFHGEYERLVSDRPRMRKDLEACVWDESRLGTEGLFFRLDQRIREESGRGSKPSVHFTNLRPRA